MSRRRERERGIDPNNPLLKGLVIVAIVGLIVAVVGHFLASSGNDASCGDRENDPERDGYCLTSKKDFDELVIVTGNTQNSPAPELDFTQGDLYDLLSGVFYNTEQGDLPNVNIVSAAGENHTVDFKNKYKVAKSVTASNVNLKKLGKELNDAIKTSPSGPRADYLGAILEAKDLFNRSAENPVILVVGSGYSDSGILNFASDDIMGRYLKNPDYIVDILTQDHHVKEDALDGITLQWYNIGEVVAPQPNLNSHKDDIEEIYKLALSYLGAKDLDFDHHTGTTDKARSIDSQYSVQPTFVDELKIGDTLDVNENIGQFEPDHDNLINAGEVEEKLMSFAKRFNPNGNTKLKLTGYIAFCIDEGQLGTARANTIKGILMKLGVPENKIEATGKPGSPPEKEGEDHTCNSNLPETERRTVRIEVVKE